MNWFNNFKIFFSNKAKVKEEQEKKESEAIAKLGNIDPCGFVLGKGGIEGISFCVEPNDLISEAKEIIKTTDDDVRANLIVIKWLLLQGILNIHEHKTRMSEAKKLFLKIKDQKKGEFDYAFKGLLKIFFGLNIDCFCGKKIPDEELKKYV